MTTGAENVVIAGAGVAASIAASELRRHGFDVWMIQRPAARSEERIEALSSSALAAFSGLGLVGALVRAGAVMGSGFENAWEGRDRLRYIDSPWVYVERSALTRALHDEATRRGARTVRVGRLPPLTPEVDPGRGFEWAHPDLPHRSMAAIDATGRSARWIGNVERKEVKVASLYRGPGTLIMRAGRVIRTPTGWAYALFHPAQTTVGVIDTHNVRRAGRWLSTCVAEALDLTNPDTFAFVRRCAANAQWTTTPIQGQLLAVGDSAFACEPIAGHGLRFAVASAAAAVSVLATQRNQGPLDVTQRYYLNLAHGARTRHLAELDALNGGTPSPPAAPIGACDSLVFSGKVVATGVRRGDGIVEEECLRLPDGGLVRWLGEFDLMALQTIAAVPRASSALVATLRERGLKGSDVESLLRWCVDRRVLRPGPFQTLDKRAEHEPI